MGIKAGELPKADEVMNAMGSIFNDTAQNLFNAAYIGFDSNLNGSGEPDLKNTFYDIFTSDSMTITGNIEYESTLDYYYWFTSSVVESEYTSYDEFSTGTVNTNLWDNQSLGTSSLTEVGDKLIVYNEPRSNSHYNWAITKDIWDGGNFLMLTLNASVVDSNGYQTSRLYIGNTIIHSVTTPNYTGYKFQIYNDGIQCYYRRDPGTGTYDAWASCDIGEIKIHAGSLIGSWSGGTSNVTTTCDFVRYNTLVTPLLTDSYIISDDKNTTETITNCIPIFNTNSTDLKITADGTNYESITNKEIKRFTNTGTTLKNKITLLPGEYATEYAIKYNLY